MYTHKIIESMDNTIEQYEQIFSLPKEMRNELLRRTAQSYDSIKPPNQLSPYKYLDFEAYFSYLKECRSRLHLPCFVLEEMADLKDTLKLVSEMSGTELRLPYPEMLLQLRMEGVADMCLILEETDCPVQTVDADTFHSKFKYTILIHDDSIKNHQPVWEVHNLEGHIGIDINGAIASSARAFDFSKEYLNVGTKLQKDHIYDTCTKIGCYIVSFLAILHCNNVDAIKIDAPQKLNKARRKKNKVPLLDYHILKIKTKQGDYIPLSGLSGKNTNQNDKGIALHTRRGHFHTFWTGRGRTKKIVHWVAPTLVGSSKNGISTKDYKL